MNDTMEDPVDYIMIDSGSDEHVCPWIGAGDLHLETYLEHRPQSLDMLAVVASR